MQLRKHRRTDRRTGASIDDEVLCNIIMRAVCWPFLRNQANVGVYERRQEALEHTVTQAAVVLSG